MQEIKTIGLDLAKNAFHVVCCDGSGNGVEPPGLVCASDRFTNVARNRVFATKKDEMGLRDSTAQEWCGALWRRRLCHQTVV